MSQSSNKLSFRVTVTDDDDKVEEEEEEGRKKRHEIEGQMKK